MAVLGREIGALSQPALSQAEGSKRAVIGSAPFDAIPSLARDRLRAPHNHRWGLKGEVTRLPNR